MRRGDIWWADLPDPRGSEPGYRRPVLILQADSFNRSNIRTVVVAVFTTNLRLADAPGNVFIPAHVSGLTRDSVLNVSQLLALDRAFLTDQIGVLQSAWLAKVNSGLRLVLGL